MVEGLAKLDPAGSGYAQSTVQDILRSGHYRAEIISALCLKPGICSRECEIGGAWSCTSVTVLYVYLQ